MGRFEKLEPEKGLPPQDVKSAVSRLKRFDHLEIGELGPETVSRGPDGKDISVYKGQKVSVIRMDGKVYLSDSPSLPAELRKVFDFVDKNGVTPALMEELKRLGTKVDYRAPPAAEASAGDLEFWKEVNGFAAAPRPVAEESARMLEPYVEAVSHFLNKGASVEAVAETMSALTGAPGRDAERFVSGLIMGGRVRLSGARPSWPWDKYDVRLPSDSPAIFPLLCPCCEEKKATRKVSHGFRQYKPGGRPIRGIGLVEAVDYWMNSLTFEFEYPACGDCAAMFQAAGLSRFFWLAAGLAAAAAGILLSWGVGAAILAAAYFFRSLWARFAVDEVGTTMISYRMSSRYYAQLFALANGMGEQQAPLAKARANWGGLARFLFWALLLAAAAYGVSFIVKVYRGVFGLI